MQYINILSAKKKIYITPGWMFIELLYTESLYLSAIHISGDMNDPQNHVIIKIGIVNIQ